MLQLASMHTVGLSAAPRLSVGCTKADFGANVAMLHIASSKTKGELSDNMLPLSTAKTAKGRNNSTNKKSYNAMWKDFLLWTLTDSNRRPSACKADALNQLS